MCFVYEARNSQRHKRKEQGRQNASGALSLLCFVIGKREKKRNLLKCLKGQGKIKNESPTLKVASYLK